MKIHIPKLTKEDFYGLFLVLFWGQDILFSYVKAILQRIPYIKYAADYVIPMLMILCLCLSFPYFIRSISWKDIIFSCGVVTVYLLNILIYPENEELTEIAGTFFFSVFPLYFIGLRFEASKHWQILYTMSIINIWVFAIYYIFLSDNSFAAYQGTSTSYMGRAYVLLPQLLCVLTEVLKNKNILNIATGFLGFFLLLMCGNRGSVLLVLLFIIFYVLSDTGYKKRVYLYVGAISVLGVIVYYYQVLLSMLVSVFLKLGVSTRVLERLLDGTFFESSGRDAIMSKLTSAIWENPIIGHGLCSDRTITGSYAHNYAFELWTAFGVIFGSIILIATVYVIVGAWIKSTDKIYKGVLLVLICTGFLKLFVSSSFLDEKLFFMLLGCCVAQLRSNKFKIAELGENKK